MDCFLKDDTSSGFLDTPPVRLEVRSSLDEIHDVRYENEWPIARTVYRKLHLTDQRCLSLEESRTPAEVAYKALKGKAEFQHTFPKDTELSGYMKLRVWVETRSGKAGQETPDDMGLFMTLLEPGIKKCKTISNKAYSSAKRCSASPFSFPSGKAS